MNNLNEPKEYIKRENRGWVVYFYDEPSIIYPNNLRWWRYFNYSDAKKGLILIRKEREKILACK